MGQLIVDGLLLLSCAAFILFYSIPLGLLTLSSLPLYGMLVFCFHKDIVTAQRHVMAAQAVNESNDWDLSASVGARRRIARGPGCGVAPGLDGSHLSGLLIPAAMRIALANVQLQGARVAFDRMYDFTALAPEYELDEEDQQQFVHAFDFGFISSVATLVSVYGL